MARDDVGESRNVQQLSERSASSPETGAQGRPSALNVAGVPQPKRVEDAEQLRRALAQLERENRRLRKRCEEAELEINHLERSLKNTENTLSFRLGYALIHSTKSLDALRSLPSALLELKRDSRRRQERSQLGMLLTAVRASALSAARGAWFRGKRDMDKRSEEEAASPARSGKSPQ